MKAEAKGNQIDEKRSLDLLRGTETDESGNQVRFFFFFFFDLYLFGVQPHTLLFFLIALFIPFHLYCFHHSKPSNLTHSLTHSLANNLFFHVANETAIG